MKTLIISTLLLATLYADSTDTAVQSIMSSIRSEDSTRIAAEKKKKSEVKNITKINYPAWLTKSYQANN